MYKQQLHRLFRFLIITAAIIILCVTFNFTASYIYPFLLAIIISFCINPAVTFVEETIKLPRSLATFLILLIALVSILGFIVVIISELIHGTSYLADIIPRHFQSFIFLLEDFLNKYVLPLYHNLASFFQTLSPEQQKSISETSHQLIQQFASFGADIFNTILLQISQTLKSLPNSITFMFFTVLATFFMTKDWYWLLDSSKKIIPESLQITITRIRDHLRKIFMGYIKAQLQLMLLTAITIMIGLFILEIDHALTISILTVLADMLPFIGTGLVFIPWIIYLFITANYPLTISLSILYMFTTIQRQVLEPKFISEGIGLNPLITLLALFIGLKIWGISGLLIGPILVMAGNAFYQAGVFHQIARFIKKT